jgi:anti-sigma factor RsiW
MTISDETLMAFADGELDDAARAAVEMALRADPQLEKRVAEHRALRQRIQAAYSAELSEPVPERLLSAAKRRADASGTNVVNLQDARDAKARDAARARPLNTWWRPVGSIAASLVIGFGLGYARWHQSSPLTRNAGGALVASGQLAQVLSQQLAADGSPAAAVQIGISFLAKSGDYCRTFVLSGAISPAGLACRHGREWQILTLAQSAATGNATAAYRTAASEMSPAILKAVEEQISGEPLGSTAEAAARSKDWSSAR